MNSSEQKDFEHATPTDDEVNDVVSRLRQRLSESGSGSELAEAYEKAIRILSEQDNSYDQLLDSSSSATTRTMVALALRYLNGETGADVLLNYPSKK